MLYDPIKQKSVPLTRSKYFRIFPQNNQVYVQANRKIFRILVLYYLFCVKEKYVFTGIRINNRSNNPPLLIRLEEISAGIK